MKMLSNLRISKKLIVGFVTVALIAVIIGGVGLFGILKLEAVDNLLFEQNLGGMGYTGDLYGNFQGLRYALKKFEIATDEQKAAVQKETDDYTIKIDELMTAYATLASSSNAEIKAQFEENDANWNAWKDTVKKAYTAQAEGKAAEAMEYFAKFDEITATLKDGISNLLMLNYMDAQARSNSNKAVAQSAIITVLIICVIGVIISVILGLALSRNIGKPVAAVAYVTNVLAVGDADMERGFAKRDDTWIERKDEIGELARALTKLFTATAQQAQVMSQVEQGDLTVDVEVRSENDVLGKGLSGLVSNMSDVVSGIISAADQVASGAQLVSNSSMALSQGATEQASSVEELTASLEEISAQTSANAQNAEKASQMATSAKNEAEQGDTQMNALLKAMDAINASSSNINKIIKVIDDIAFQTNILALNAAVEAARAGQHGKGFAVVAEEVRTLAGKSANAVKDTTEMIDGSIRNVESGIKIANDTAQALKRIVTEVTNATELVGSIAIASKEQALGIEQLNQGIIQVSQVVQNNAATSEESAAASEELSSQADQLKEVVSVFKVKNIKTSAPSKLTATSAARIPERTLPAGKPKISLEGDFGKY